MGEETYNNYLSSPCLSDKLLLYISSHNLELHGCAIIIIRDIN